MPEDHERIEELLAGYALRSITGPDAAEADSLLSEHVPGCQMCRETLTDFQAVTGELALAAPAVSPPDLLFPRIRREVEADRPASARPRLAMAAAAAGIVALVGTSALSVALGLRVSDVQARVRLFAEAAEVASRPDADEISLVDRTGGARSDMTEVSAPGVRYVYLLGRGIPPPRTGTVYRVWYRDGEGWHRAGDFVDSGDVILRFPVDPATLQEILITQEAGDPGAAPSGTLRWAATSSSAAA